MIGKIIALILNITVAFSITQADGNDLGKNDVIYQAMELNQTEGLLNLTDIL